MKTTTKNKNYLTAILFALSLTVTQNVNAKDGFLENDPFQKKKKVNCSKTVSNIKNCENLKMKSQTFKNEDGNGIVTVNSFYQCSESSGFQKTSNCELVGVEKKTRFTDENKPLSLPSEKTTLELHKDKIWKVTTTQNCDVFAKECFKSETKTLVAVNNDKDSIKLIIENLEEIKINYGYKRSMGILVDMGRRMQHSKIENNPNSKENGNSESI